MKNIFSVFIFLIFGTSVSSQEKVYYPEYRNGIPKDGTYKIKSFSEEFSNESLPVIEASIKELDPRKYPNFLNPHNKEIILFENHDVSHLKPIGKLTELTQVRVDSTIHKYKFKDLTNCVWNRILINDKYYYTDADIHDFSISKELNKFNQKLRIIAQFDGYDGAYHLGYPEYFFMIFTDNENKLISKTKVLEFYLNDEFAMEEDILKLEWNDKNLCYEITLIGAEEQIKIIWDGKKSVVE